MAFMPTGTLCRGLLTTVLLVALLSCVTTVTGHVPLGAGSNEQITSATQIQDPQKSYVIYNELHEGEEAQYYRFSMVKGQVLSGTLQVPGPGTMIPGMVITGPGVTPSGEIPPFVEIPAGSYGMVVQGKPPGTPSYEPFSPAAVYGVARFRMPVTVDGDYYIAVYGPDGGKYSLAPGFVEEFSPSEWVMVPVSTIGIHIWEGQSLAAILAPFFIVVISGVILLCYRQKKENQHIHPLSWVCAFSGLLYLGGASVVIVQGFRAMMFTGFSSSVFLTLLFITVPLILGVIAVRLAFVQPAPFTGLEMILIGLTGLVFWAGVIIGPVIAIITGVMILVTTRLKRI